MSMDWIGVVTLVLGALALLGGIERAFHILIFSLLFQAAAALKVGSNTIMPPHLLLAFLAAALLIRGGMAKDFAEAIRFPKAGFWLTLFSAWCAIAGLFLPRIFEGAFDVYPIAPSAGAVAFHPEPLAVSAGNATQSLYVLGSLFAFLAVAGYCVDLRRSFAMCDALIAFAAGNVLFATLDLLGYLTGHPDLLDPLHNAGYAMHTNEVVAGLHRISGTFSETAQFSSITLGTLPFVLTLFLNGYRTTVTLVLSASQLGLLLISTSTTACVGLVAVVAYLLVDCALKMRAGRASRREALFVALAPLTAVSVAAVAAFDATTWSAIADFLNVVIFDKGTSDSAMERSAMNLQAVGNLLSTNGLGAGTGSVRASSFPLALVANVGIPGLLAYGAFLAKLLTGVSRPLGGEANVVRESARAAVVGSLAAATISGALVDMGLLFFVFAALACCMSDDRHLAVQRRLGERATSTSRKDDALPAHAS